jgi:hypothetical protein
MGNKAACPECPEQVVNELALSYRIGENVRKGTATVSFFDQFAGKQVSFMARFRGQNIKTDVGHMLNL